jgi:hypothetical protein
MVEPYGWGISVSNSGEIHLSAVTQSGGGHGYLDRRTGAYENVVNIVAGQYGKVTHYGGPNCP